MLARVCLNALVHVHSSGRGRSAQARPLTARLPAGAEDRARVLRPPAAAPLVGEGALGFCVRGLPGALRQGEAGVQAGRGRPVSLTRWHPARMDPAAPRRAGCRASPRPIRLLQSRLSPCPPRPSAQNWFWLHLVPAPSAAAVPQTTQGPRLVTAGTSSSLEKLGPRCTRSDLSQARPFRAGASPALGALCHPRSPSLQCARALN